MYRCGDYNIMYRQTVLRPKTSGSGIIPSTSREKLSHDLSWALGVLYASFVGPPMCPYTDRYALEFD